MIVGARFGGLGGRGLRGGVFRDFDAFLGLSLMLGLGGIGGLLALVADKSGGIDRGGLRRGLRLFGGVLVGGAVGGLFAIRILGGVLAVLAVFLGLRCGLFRVAVLGVLAGVFVVALVGAVARAFGVVVGVVGAITRLSRRVVAARCVVGTFRTVVTSVGRLGALMTGSVVSAALVIAVVAYVTRCFVVVGVAFRLRRVTGGGDVVRFVGGAECLIETGADALQ